jgi:hypothetical protein
MQKPDISYRAFWDVRFSDIDFEENSTHVMEKVFNYGTWKDEVTIMRFYGLQRIRKEIVNAGLLKTVCAICPLSFSNITGLFSL